MSQRQQNSSNQPNMNNFATQNTGGEEEEFLPIPPSTVLDEAGIRSIEQAEARDGMTCANKYAEIRFKDGETKILRFDPAQVKFEDKDPIKLGEDQPVKYIERYHYMCSENMGQGKWTKFKLFKIAPTWGRQILANIKEGNLTLKIARKGIGQTDTDYRIVVMTNVK
jgi:hypothetical protein